MSDFFSNYPEFIKSINMTHTNPNVVMNDIVNVTRLNHRHNAFFQWPIWEGKRILDIGGYDGRWSFAALKAGAIHTTIVELRQSVIDRGKKTFSELGMNPNQYEFINSDFARWKPHTKFDVVLCSGFLSHVYDYPTIFSIIRECDPEYLLLDTSVNTYQGNVIIPSKNADREGNAHITDTSFIENDGKDIIKTWTAQPSKGFVYDLAETYDFELVDEYDWQKKIDQMNTLGIEDYWTGKRITTLWKRRDGWRWDRKTIFDK